MAGLLVVNADDLGVSEGATLGIVKSHREGIVTSASIAVTTPFYRHAVEQCVRSCPDLGIGLHFTLTSGRPAAPIRRVPSLVDSDGRFRWKFLSLLGAVGAARRPQLIEEIGVELDAQLARLREDGIAPDHIDGERHVHLIPGLFELVLAAAKRNGIPYVRAGKDFGFRAFRISDSFGAVANGGVVKSGLLSALSARARGLLGESVRSPDYLASYLYTGRPVTVQRTLETEASGVVELMVHPGLPALNGKLDLGNHELERYLSSEDRRRELDACLRSRTELRSWSLTNYRELAKAGEAR